MNKFWKTSIEGLEYKVSHLVEGHNKLEARISKLEETKEQPSRDDKIRELFDEFIHSIKPNLTEHSMELIEKIYVLLGE